MFDFIFKPRINYFELSGFTIMCNMFADGRWVLGMTIYITSVIVSSVVITMKQIRDEKRVTDDFLDQVEKLRAQQPPPPTR